MTNNDLKKVESGLGEIRKAFVMGAVILGTMVYIVHLLRKI